MSTIVILAFMEIAIFLGILILLRFVIKNTKTYKTILAVIFMLAAVPAGMFAEIGLNGCCGAPSTGLEGLGYALMALLFAAGLVLLITTRKSPN